LQPLLTSVTDGQTNRRTDGRTVRDTERPSAIARAKSVRCALEMTDTQADRQRHKRTINMTDTEREIEPILLQ